MNAALRHALIALGAGAAAAIALIPATGDINWRAVAVSAGQAILTSLGVGLAEKKL